MKLLAEIAQPIGVWKHDPQAREDARDFAGEITGKCDRSADVRLDVAKVCVAVGLAGSTQKDAAWNERVFRSAIAELKASALDDVDLESLRRVLLRIGQSSPVRMIGPRQRHNSRLAEHSESVRGYVDRHAIKVGPIRVNAGGGL